jgi:hypothetical protein
MRRTDGNFDEVLPSIGAAVMGIGHGFVSAAGFPNCTGPGVLKRDEAVRRIVAHGPSATARPRPSGPREVTRFVAQLVRTRFPGQCAYFVLENGTCIPEGDPVPVAAEVPAPTPTLFMRAYPDYPTHRVQRLTDAYDMLAGSYHTLQSIAEPLRLRAFYAVGLFVHCGYPTPGVSGDRWAFEMPDVGQPPTTRLTFTWPLFGYQLPFDVFTGETVRVGLRGVQTPIVTAANADRQLLVHPFTVTAVTPLPGVPDVAVRHVQSDHGMECIRRDYMCPIAVEHIARDGTLTVL